MQDEKFIWDENKNIINIQKHGVSFQEARNVFYDEFVLFYPDYEHSYDEERFIAIGESSREKILMVCYCERDDAEIIRLISARKANKHEIETYYGGMV